MLAFAEEGKRRRKGGSKRLKRECEGGDDLPQGEGWNEDDGRRWAGVAVRYEQREDPDGGLMQGSTRGKHTMTRRIPQRNLKRLAGGGGER